MSLRSALPSLLIACILFSCQEENKPESKEDQPAAEKKATAPEEENPAEISGEKHLTNLRQLTFGGENAEAYWSFDDKSLVFQATNSNWGADCDQIFIVDWANEDLSSKQPKLISTGKGRTTCAYYLADGNILYASTHLVDENCPPVPERKPGGKYLWPIYEGYDIFVANPEGEIIRTLTDTPGYDAEATVSPKGDRIVFTSLRTGDLELYTMNIDGTDVKQITHDLGYDGGAFFSPDGSKLVWRASRPKTDKEVAEYKDLLAQGLVQPTQMELFVSNADGTDIRQVTNLGQANWAPFFHPSGEKIIFSSNHTSKRGFPFNLYLINIDGTGLEQVSADENFDAFPVFSNDGKKLAFSSNRNNGGTRETNLFVADWVD